jgi:hypothetical protein
MVVVPASQATTEAGLIDSFESMPGLLKRLQIRAQATVLLPAPQKIHLHTVGTV